MHICIAEDDTALRSSLSFVLRRRNHTVLETANGKQALEGIRDAAREGRPVDMLITDIRMPGMDGVELLTLLAEMEQTLPTVVISGHGDRDMLIDLLRLGCDNFLAKPFEPDEVLAKVDEVMRKVELRREATGGTSADLACATSELDRRAATYRRDLESLRGEVADAAHVYRDLIEGCRDDLSVDMELRNRTYRDLGGDFAGSCCRGRICDFLVADVAGHDLAASYQTILIKSFFDDNCRTGKGGRSMLERLNRGLAENDRNERMTTAVFARFDLEAGRVQLVSAGHPPVLVLRAGQPSARAVTGNGDVLGLYGSIRTDVNEMDIVPGDRFFFYTDGVTGASHVDGPTGERRVLSAGGLVELVEVFGHLPLPEQTDAIWRYALNFCRGKLVDDMLLMVVEVPSE